MNEHAGQEMAAGWWCPNCEFFEDEDHTDTTAEQCVSCGCDGADHIPVVVIGK